MGQKTHPVGFRLQVSKDWKSTWFTENSFASELESDVKIRKYLKARLPNAGISKVDISRTSKSITITIFTARPGIVIGKGGEEVNRLKDEVKQYVFDLFINTNMSLGKEDTLFDSKSPIIQNMKNGFQLSLSIDLTR